MKNLNVSLTPASGAFNLGSARALALSIAESDAELVEPELIAWVDRSTGVTSPIRTGPNGWHDYGFSHDGRLEVGVGEGAAFIFADSSPFDSYEHFNPGPFVNIRDAQGNEMICRPGAKECVPLDEWTSKLT